jgi:hypothetical protein
LCTLQGSRKWQSSQPNLREGDVVLLKHKSVHSNDWPLGVVQIALVSEDGLVRKSEIRVVKDGRPHVFTRPISELVSVLAESA